MKLQVRKCSSLGRAGGTAGAMLLFKSSRTRDVHTADVPPGLLVAVWEGGGGATMWVEAVVECAGRFIRPRLCFHYSYSNSRWKRECVTVLAWSQVKRRGKSTCFLMAFFIRVNACGALGQNVLKLHCAVSRPARWTTARSWRRGGSTDAKQWCRV